MRKLFYAAEYHKNSCMWSVNTTYSGILVVLLHCLLRDKFKSYKLFFQKFTCFDVVFSPPCRKIHKNIPIFVLSYSVSTFKLVFTGLHPYLQINLLCVCCLKDFVVGTLHMLHFKSLLNAAERRERQCQGSVVVQPEVLGLWLHSNAGSPSWFSVWPQINYLISESQGLPL